MTDPQGKGAAGGDEVTDQQVIRTFASITSAFCFALVLVGGLGVLFIVPEPTVRIVGLVIGVILALVSWFMPGQVIRASLDRGAAHAEPADVPGLVRTAVFVGLAFCDAPALIALVLAVADGHDVGALIITVPVAVVSLVVNVSGPDAVRRHLARARRAQA